MNINGVIYLISNQIFTQKFQALPLKNIKSFEYRVSYIRNKTLFITFFIFCSETACVPSCYLCVQLVSCLALNEFFNEVIPANPFAQHPLRAIKSVCSRPGRVYFRNCCCLVNYSFCRSSLSPLIVH